MSWIINIFTFAVLFFCIACDQVEKIETQKIFSPNKEFLATIRDGIDGGRVAISNQLTGGQEELVLQYAWCNQLDISWVADRSLMIRSKGFELRYLYTGRDHKYGSYNVLICNPTFTECPAPRSAVIQLKRCERL